MEWQEEPDTEKEDDSIVVEEEVEGSPHVEAPVVASQETTSPKEAEVEYEGVNTFEEYTKLGEKEKKKYGI